MLTAEARYGKEKEVEALAELNKFLTETGATTVEPCGLFVDTSKPFLAASPDGVVGLDAVVEVKCPLRCLETSLECVSPGGKPAADVSF